MNAPDPFERLLDEMAAFLRLFYANVKKPLNKQADLRAQLVLLRIEAALFQKAYQNYLKSLPSNASKASKAPLTKKDEHILNKAKKLHEEVDGIHTTFAFLKAEQEKSKKTDKSGVKNRRTRLSRRLGGYKDWKRM